jgi:hypothetical protein
MKRFLEEGDELGLDWDHWADGQPHRLKRKRHLRGHPSHLVREAARNAAVRRGKVVQTLDYWGSFWVQFSDYRVRAGEPCPCGGREFDHMHPLYARCRSCGSQLELQKSSLFDEDEDGEAPSPLDEYSDVHLRHFERSLDGDVYRGYANDERGPVLLFVEFSRFTDVPNEAVTSENAAKRVVSLRAVPLAELAGLVDADRLLSRDDGDWDLIL